MTTASTDFTAANRSFFDDLAAKYGIVPWQKKLSLQITTYIQQNLDFIGIPKHSGPTTLLDYACGTGMISRALGPSVTSVQALDLSSNMVECFNNLAAMSEIASVRKAHAIQGNLLIDKSPPVELNGPELHDFDVVAVGMGLHHFDEPAKAITRLAQRLKVGGILLIVDFVEEENKEEAGHGRLPTGAEHITSKHGFNAREMKEMMQVQGLGGFGWSEMLERVEIELDEGKTVSRKGFLARGVKLSVA